MTKYTSLQVCRIVNVTYRQLDYWNRIGLIFPSGTEAHGSGTRRVWLEEDLERIRRIKVASRLSKGSLQDCLDQLDDILEELHHPIPA